MIQEHLREVDMVPNEPLEILQPNIDLQMLYHGMIYDMEVDHP